MGILSMDRQLKYYILTVLLIISAAVKSQISEGGTPPSFQYTTSLRAAVAPYEVSVNIDKKRLMWEDSIAAMNHGAIRVAETFPVNLNIDSTGVWSVLPDSQKIWRQTVTAPDADGLIISYKEFYIPEGGKLYIYNSDKSQILGAYTNQTNRAGGGFANEIVRGDTFTLEYVASDISDEKPRIELLDVGYVYNRAALYAASDNVLVYGDASNNCIQNINCFPASNPWRDQKRGVVIVISKRNSRWWACTGSLINNTRQDGTPYVLTAAHCFSNDHGVTYAGFESIIYYFNYEEWGCTTGTKQPDITQTVVGSTLKSFIPLKQGGDGALLLLSSSVPASYKAYFNGWDNSSAIAQSGAVIHQPLADIKKLTLYDTPLATATLTAEGVTAATLAHLRVVYDGNGVTNSGSSGAPLFNENGLIIGILSAGSSTCSSPFGPDYYGRLNYLWDKYSDSSLHFKQYLDPDNTGVTSLVGYDPNGIVAGTDDIIDSSVDYTLFPNPAANEININSKSIIRTVEIFDIAGRLLFSKKGYSSSTLSVNISDWSRGVYTVVIQSGNGKQTDKFIKN
ncbi:T9SS type A sorting domain-containing protein [Dysgonomonas macrotermitis]|nr:T9SS type A sorting domain-containing protein [Dysgonomonas macrotermitis]